MAKHYRICMGLNHLAPYFKDVVRGVLRYVRESPSLELIRWHSNPVILTGGSRMPPDCDGIIGSTGNPARPDSLINRIGDLPMVNVSNSIAYDSLPRVLTNDFQVGCEAAQHLLGQGYQHFGCLASQTIFSDERIGGFRHVLEKSGHEPAVLALKSGLSHREAEIRMSEFIAALPQCTGVFVVEDDIGFHFLECLQAGKRLVPVDIGVIGVNDDAWGREVSGWPLSSIALNGLEVGYSAARLLDDILHGRDHKSVQYVSPIGVHALETSDRRRMAIPEIRRSITFMQTHLGDKLSIDQIAASVGLSRRALETRFRKHLAQSPFNVLTELRMQFAKRLLVESSLPIHEIASRCGYAHTSEFSRVFRGAFHITPSAMRRKG